MEPKNTAARRSQFVKASNAYYQAHREEIIAKRLEHYHATKTTTNPPGRPRIKPVEPKRPRGRPPRPVDPNAPPPPPKRPVGRPKKQSEVVAAGVDKNESPI
jgi:hypothetical protein